MHGGYAVVRALEKEGVEYISGFAGGGELPLWPALRPSRVITVFSARHERQGVEIADGYARETGKVGVARCGTGARAVPARALPTRLRASQEHLPVIFPCFP